MSVENEGKKKTVTENEILTEEYSECGVVLEVEFHVSSTEGEVIIMVFPLFI